MLYLSIMMMIFCSAGSTVMAEQSEAYGEAHGKGQAAPVIQDRKPRRPSPEAGRGVSYTVYSCTCTADWNCSLDESVKGHVMSIPNAPYESISERMAQDECREQLTLQIGNICETDKSYGSLVLNDIQTCPSSQRSSPPMVKRKKTRTTGAIYWRDLSVPALGEAWRDEYGLIWGDLAREKDGSPQRLTHSEAANYCKNLGSGARLATPTEYIRLARSMGDGSGLTREPKGYVPEILPGLEAERVWSTIEPYRDSTRTYYFGGGGSVDHTYNEYNWRGTVRCVVETPSPKQTY